MLLAIEIITQDKPQFNAGYVLATGSTLSGDQLFQMVHRARTITDKRIAVLCFNNIHTGYTRHGEIAESKRDAVTVDEAFTRLQNPDRLAAFAGDDAVHGVARMTFHGTVRDVRNVFACPASSTPGLNAVLAPAAARRSNLGINSVATMRQLATFEGMNVAFLKYSDAHRANVETQELWKRIKAEKQALRGELPAAMVAHEGQMPLLPDDRAELDRKRKRESLSPESKTRYSKDMLCQQYGMTNDIADCITKRWIEVYFDLGERTVARYNLTKHLLRKFNAGATPGYDQFVSQAQVDAQFRRLGGDESVKMFLVHQLLRACGFDGAADTKLISCDDWRAATDGRHRACANLLSAWRTWSEGKKTMVPVAPGLSSFRHAMRLLFAFVGFSVVQTNIVSRARPRRFDMHINIGKRYRVLCDGPGGGLVHKPGESDADEKERVLGEIAAWTRATKARPERAEVTPFRPVV